MRRSFPPLVALLTACADVDPQAADGIGAAEGAWPSADADTGVDVAALPADAAPAPGVLALTASPLITGAPYTLTVSGLDSAPPGRGDARVFLGGSVTLGGWCPPVIAPDCLDLPSTAVEVLRRPSRRGGTRAYGGIIPATQPAGTFALQAAQRLRAGGADTSAAIPVTVYDGQADPDNDGLTTLDEYAVHGTDWLLADSDNGGEDDAAELAAGRNPLDPADDVVAIPVTYAVDVQPLLQSRCAGCHTSGGGSAGLRVDNYSSITRQNATQLPSMPRIDLTGNRQNSYLWHKISGTQASVGGAGGRMGNLSAAELDLIGAWIDGGAVEGAP